MSLSHLLGCAVRAISTTLAILACAASAQARSDDTPRGWQDVAFNKSGFVGALPMKVVLCPLVFHPGQDAAPADLKALEQDVLRLGNLRGREFLLLSPNSQKPQLTEAPSPVYPEDVRSRLGSLKGNFRFWLLVSVRGEVEALYCLSAPDRDVGAIVADALGRWRFTPAERSGEKVAVLVQVVVSPVQRASGPAIENAAGAPAAK